MLIAILIFVGLPLLLALLAKIFFNFFFPLTKINKTAEDYDKEDVQLPNSPCKVKNLRTHNEIGEKIIYTQHLAPQVNEYRKIVMRTLVETLLVEFMLIFILALGAATKSNGSETATFLDNVKLVIYEWKLQYLLPIGMIGLCLKFLFQYNFLSEQISKYIKNS